MILADKIITLRKKNGWSQEELAEQMNVSRQSVSKWESAQSVPDLEKILKLGQIFGVSTDFLLKDELEEEEYVETISNNIEETPVRRVSIEEANNFLTVKDGTKKQVAFGTVLCILSPICLMLLGAASEVPAYGISENFAGGIGMIVLFVMIAIAVAMFISVGTKTSAYEYLEKEVIETEYGVSGMVKERQKQFKDTYTKYNIIGTCCCILSVVPLFAATCLTEEDFYMIIATCVLIVFVAIGVWFFILGGIPWSSMQKLLQEEDYSVEAKMNKKKTSGISGIYWLIATALYLGISLYSNEWEKTWIIWPVAGVLYGALITAYNTFRKEK